MSNPKHRTPLQDKEGLNKVVDSAIELGIHIEKHKSKKEKFEQLSDQEVAELLAFGERVEDIIDKSYEPKPKRWWEFWRRNV